LKCLNDLNIAHLDITTSNLMCDENDNFVLIDFGLSLTCGQQPHPLGCGTPGIIILIRKKKKYVNVNNNKYI